MTTATPSTSRTTSSPREPKPADVFVAFGITGDLAKVMTFRSLYRLEKRGLLDCPILGVAVDDWTVDQLKERARESIIGTGEELDEKVFDRLAARFAYVAGDFSDAATYESVAEAIDGAEHPVFYLEIPPFLFGAVVKGLAEAGLTENARVVVEKPFGHDAASAHELADQLHEYLDESQIYRIDHFLGRWGSRRSSTCGSRTRCSSRSGTGTTSSPSRSRWRRTSGSRTAATSTTRWARCATWS